MFYQMARAVKQMMREEVRQIQNIVRSDMTGAIQIVVFMRRTDMQELEKILEEIEQRKARAEKLIVKPPHDKLDQVANDTAEAFIEAYKECQDIIRKHMKSEEE